MPKESSRGRWNEFVRPRGSRLSWGSAWARFFGYPKAQVRGVETRCSSPPGCSRAAGCAASTLGTPATLGIGPKKISANLLAENEKEKKKKKATANKAEQTPPPHLLLLILPAGPGRAGVADRQGRLCWGRLLSLP